MIALDRLAQPPGDGNPHPAAGTAIRAVLDEKPRVCHGFALAEHPAKLLRVSKPLLPGQHCYTESR